MRVQYVFVCVSVCVCVGATGLATGLQDRVIILELAHTTLHDIYHSRGQRVDGIFHRRLVSIDFR